MKSIRFFALLAFAATVAANPAQPEVPGVPLLVSTSNFNLEPSCDATSVSTCLDCNRIAACINGQEDEAITCSALNSGRPFCNSFNGVSTCQATPDIVNGCTQPVEVFTCTSPGYFPSARHCNQYYICNAEGLATPYICPQPGFLYNPATNMCRFVGANYAAECAARTFDCVNTNTLFLPFPEPDHDYYVYCKPDASLSFANPLPIVLRCPASYRFVDNSCQFECTEVGVFPMLNSNTAYIECLAAGDDQPLVMNVVNCPPSMIFNGQGCQPASSE